MTSIAASHEHHEAPPGAPSSPWRWLTGPGWIRAAWMSALFAGIGLGIVVLLRWWGGYTPILQTESCVTVSLLTALPVGFLAGIGAFDYWVHYFLGKPTRPEDHSGHGAKTWKDYFRVNTDHKVIGIQYVTTTIFFFLAGGLLAMLVRAELARPGMQFTDTETYNGLFSAHASLMIFLFVIPAFAGLANFVIPLMIGAPDMAFPRLNALSFWLLPIAGTMMLSSFFVDGGPFAAGWTGYPTLSTSLPLGQTFFNMAVQWAGASSIDDRAELPGDHHHHARAGDDLLAHAAARLGELHDFAAGRARHAVHRGLAVHGAVRPGDAHALLRTPLRRLHAGVPAHLLVLLAPGGVHHDAARLRHRLGGDLRSSRGSRSSATG